LQRKHGRALVDSGLDVDDPEMHFKVRVVEEA
jgi:hypothetical protein